MSKILILGRGPLPFESARYNNALGLRTWQLVKPLIKDGHEISLLIVESKIKKEQFSKYNDGDNGKIKLHTKPDSNFNLEELQRFHDGFKPDCIVAITHLPAFYASKIKTEVPIWVDLTGHWLTEGQALTKIKGNKIIDSYIKMEYTILIRADKVSCISESSEYSTIGELGLVGRLNRETLGYKFTTKIMPSYEERENKINRGVLRRKLVKRSDFVILWMGGYNVWTDVRTLFHGIEEAIKKNKNIKFVSIGGKIYNHDKETYPEFLNLIKKSKFKKHFILLGWVNTEDVNNYIKEADVGIVIEKDIYEGKLGTKLRIISWFYNGLPVICNEVTELSEIIKREKIGFVLPPEDIQSLKDLILYVSKLKKSELSKVAKKARAYCLRNFSFDTTTKELREWAKNPRRAPGYKNLKYVKDLGYSNINQIIENKIRNTNSTITPKIFTLINKLKRSFRLIKYG